MRTFVDLAGRTWTVTVNVGGLKRLKGQGIDPFAGLDAFLPRIIGDPVFCGQVLWVFCQPQAEKAGVDEATFLASLGGDALASARQAFVEEFADFFPDPPLRKALRELVEKYLHILQREVEPAEPLKIGGERSTNAPEYSD